MNVEQRAEMDPISQSGSNQAIEFGAITQSESKVTSNEIRIQNSNKPLLPHLDRNRKKFRNFFINLDAIIVQMFNCVDNLTYTGFITTF